MKQVQTAIIDLDADRMVAVDEEARSLWGKNKRLINCEKIIKKYLTPLPGKYQVSLFEKSGLMISWAWELHYGNPDSTGSIELIARGAAFSKEAAIDRARLVAAQHRHKGVPTEMLTLEFND